MNIALIGAPGTGKTALANGLKDELGDEAAVLDDYVKDFSERYDVATGVLGEYTTNVGIAVERHLREWVLRQNEATKVVITCGTLIETAVYVAMNFAAMANSMAEEEIKARAPQMDATLRMMAAMYDSTFAYDLAFYLPAATTDEDAIWMDKQLQGALAGFQLIPVTRLDHEDRVATAMKVINEA